MQQQLTDNFDQLPQPPVGEPLSLNDVAVLLTKHYGLHEGLFNLIIEFQIGVGTVGPANSVSPGAMVGISKIGLMPAKEPGALTIDAAEVNPIKSSRKKKSNI